MPELTGQDFEVDEDGVPRLHLGTRQGPIISTVDTEMRHGCRSQHQRFDGNKLSTAATKTAELPTTTVEVARASEQDGPQAKELIDSQPDALRPERVSGLGRHRLRNGPPAPRFVHGPLGRRPRQSQPDRLLLGRPSRMTRPNRAAATLP